MSMSTVGLRELKNKLSKYVARARSGESVSITDRGQIVAELSPAKRQSLTGEPTVTLEDLRRKGASSMVADRTIRICIRTCRAF